MAECMLIVYKDSPMPWARLRLNDNNGRIYWEWIPIDQNGSVTGGYVEKRGKDYILIKSSNKKEFGTLVNFSLYNYHPEITYIIKDKRAALRCKVEPEFEPSF